MITLNKTAKARMMLTVGLLTIAGIVLDVWVWVWLHDIAIANLSQGYDKEATLFLNRNGVAFLL
jgi:hypothetical protein